MVESSSEREAGMPMGECSSASIEFDVADYTLRNYGHKKVGS